MNAPTSTLAGNPANASAVSAAPAAWQDAGRMARLIRAIASLYCGAVLAVLTAAATMRSVPAVAGAWQSGLVGVLLGSLLLAHLVSKGSQHLMNGLLGAVLVLTAVYQIFYSFRPVAQRANKDRSRWMPFLMFPVGAEVGFSSAGAGALGTAALLSLTALVPAQVVGTDILFGFLLSLVGSGAHMFSHSNNPTLLKHLIIGGIGGVLLGTFCAPYIPKRPLRFALWVWLLIIGVQFLYTNLYVGH